MVGGDDIAAQRLLAAIPIHPQNEKVTACPLFGCATTGNSPRRKHRVTATSEATLADIESHADFLEAAATQMWAKASALRRFGMDLGSRDFRPHPPVNLWHTERPLPPAVPHLKVISGTRAKTNRIIDFPEVEPAVSEGRP